MSRGSVVIRYTHHADEVMREREIPPEWVERTLIHPLADEPDPNDPHLRRAFAPVPERDGRLLRVVYGSDADGLRVITAFLDRGRGR